MNAFFAWLQDTTLAHSVAHDDTLIAILSGLHLIGMTVTAGGALVSGLRLSGMLLTERPIREIAGAAARGMDFGLALSVASGFVLFVPRALSAAGMGLFQLKMALLLTAILFQVGWYRRLASAAAPGVFAARAGGALAITLWLAIACVGSLFILLE